MTILFNKPLEGLNSSVQASNEVSAQLLALKNQKHPLKFNEMLGYGVRFVKGRFARHRSRLQLLKLDDHQLRDIGITREQANEEMCQSFWR